MKLDSMKVAIINQHIAYAVGGSELQCNFLAMGLSERGHRVTYIAPSRPQEQVRGYSYEIVAVNDSSRLILPTCSGHHSNLVNWR